MPKIVLLFLRGCLILLPLLASVAATQRKSNITAGKNATGKMIPTPHQSKGRLVRFPGSTLAAQDLGVSRAHLHRVLTGERQSATLVTRWQAWLQLHPQFNALQPARK
jgi:hypothetical protein